MNYRISFHRKFSHQVDSDQSQLGSSYLAFDHLKNGCIAVYHWCRNYVCLAGGGWGKHSSHGVVGWVSAVILKRKHIQQFKMHLIP